MRAKIIGRIADHLIARQVGHPWRVAVDGITAAGKTTLAAEVAAAVAQRGWPAVQLSMDGFHRPRADRYRAGRWSAVGYYRDAYDFDALARLALVPLGPGGDLRYHTRARDLATDVAVTDKTRTAPAHAVVMVDGSFLQVRELTGLWDEVIFVDTGFAVARERGVRRDSAALGGAEAARAAYDHRYHAAGRIYLDEVDRRAQASIVVGLDDVHQPDLRRIGGPADSSISLFSYGTLQQDGVQLDHFGRTLVGVPAVLPGYRTDWVTVTDPAGIAVSGSDRHPIVRPSAEPGDAVAGTVFDLTTAELAAADRYEVEDYRRAWVRLGSGQPAWVYLAQNWGPGTTAGPPVSRR